MIGLVLLWVGAVLFLNGIWLLGLIEDREIAVINIFVGVVTLLVAFVTAFQSGANLPAIRAGALTLLFAFTYLWVGINRFLKADGRGLGWYCLFVAITAVPVAIQTLRGAGGDAWQTWLGADWAAWAVLWFLYWVFLVRKRVSVNVVAAVTLFEGIFTAWIPGYLLLIGVLKA
jgi:putative amide transporter protein